MSTKKKGVSDVGTYSVAVDENFACYETVSSARCIDLHRLDRPRTIGTTLERIRPLPHRWEVQK